MTRPPRTGALHLVRHGQSTWNLAGLVQGHTDVGELTDAGREQAHRAGELLTGAGAVRLLTSDLKRAVQTADVIGLATGLRPIATPLLREQSFGALEGTSTDDVVAEWERAAAGWVDENGDNLPIADLRLGGGESMRDVQARVAALLAGDLVATAEGDVVMVTHGDTIRIAVGYLLGEDLDNPVWRAVGNTDVHTVYRHPTGAPVYVCTAPGAVRGPPFRPH